MMNYDPRRKRSQDHDGTMRMSTRITLRYLTTMAILTELMGRMAYVILPGGSGYASLDELIPENKGEVILSYEHRQHYVNKYLPVLISMGLVEYAANGRATMLPYGYRLTDKGMAWVQENYGSYVHEHTIGTFHMRNLDYVEVLEIPEPEPEPEPDYMPFDEVITYRDNAIDDFNFHLSELSDERYPSSEEDYDGYFKSEQLFENLYNFDMENPLDQFIEVNAQVTINTEYDPSMDEPELEAIARFEVFVDGAYSGSFEENYIYDGVHWG